MSGPLDERSGRPDKGAAAQPTLGELTARPGGLSRYLEGHPTDGAAMRRAIERARESQAEARRAIRDAALEPLDALLSSFLSAMRSIDPEALERGLEELRRAEQADRHRISPDFAPLEDDPEACERFREWARESLERSGGFTYGRLAEALNVDRKTAKRVYDEPWRMSVHAARFVRFHAGEEAYYDVLHGAGAYDAHVAEEERDRILSETEERFRAALDSLRGRGPRDARIFLEAIRHAVILSDTIADV